MFFENRVYQGSSGRVYPLPFTERISDTSVPRPWRAVHLENEWVRLAILPELGGRIHIGYDKTHDYDFFYRNEVIKPALVGLAGSWISGGVEFNWPQHHRPATFLPMCWHMEFEDDGAVTVWMSDHDPFARMRGTHGIRLRPGSTLIELRARLHNRTEEPRTFLWWANVAARSHEEYQSFFPTDVHYVADHARRAITAFPRADRPYYGVDYPSLVSAERPDADRIDYYSNIPVPTSYMVLETRDDFFGGYDHRAGAGFVHWADRRIAPGKKQWTWGDAPFGHAWDDHLTDENGPYVELMAGVYTDNQPDFSYLAPGEVREFSQYWYPIAGTGAAHQASKDAAMSLVVEDGGARIRVSASRRIDSALLRVELPDGVVERDVELSPERTVDEAFDLGGHVEETEVRVVLLEGERELLVWQLRASEEVTEPEVATEPPLPEDIQSSDELYLTGVHLEQYRHPTRRPEPYWEEALRRDPGDSRSNTALGARAYSRGEYDKAAALFRAGLARLTKRNPNPADGEAHYRLALALGRLGETEAAYDAFAKAAWDARWAKPAHVAMAYIDARTGRNDAAMACLDIAARYGIDPKATALRVLLLRRLGRDEEAKALLRDARRLDPLDALFSALDGNAPAGDGLVLLDVAGDLARAGETASALELLARAASLPGGGHGGSAPMAEYLAATLLGREGRDIEARAARVRAREASDLYAFPAGLDALDALTAALREEPADVRAAHLLGMWLFDAGRHAEALDVWSGAVECGGRSAALLRNTALAVMRVHGDAERAAVLYETAAQESSDPRIWYERDQLARYRGIDVGERLAILVRLGDRIAERNDLLVVVAELLTQVGRPTEALDLLLSRPLQPWEGGEGQAVRAFARASLAVARTSEPGIAVDVLRRALTPPASLGEAWHLLDNRAALWLALGHALAASGAETDARAAWGAAVLEAGRAPVDRATVEGVRAAVQLGDAVAAAGLRERMKDRIDALRRERARIDYFATSLPEMLLFPEDPQTTADREREGLEHDLETVAEGEGVRNR